MKLRYHYSYNIFQKSSVIVAILMSLFFVGFGFLNIGPLLKAKAGSSDFYLFLGLLLAFVIFGLIFLSFVIFFHRKMRQLIQSDDWYGLTLDAGSIISEEYDIFKKRQVLVFKKDIQNLELKIYKGTQRLIINAADKTYYLPVYLLSRSDKEKFLADLNYQK